MAVTLDAISTVARAAAAASGTAAAGAHTISASATAIGFHLEIGLSGLSDANITIGTITLGGKAFTLASGSLVHSGTTTDTFGYVLSYYMTPTSLGSALPSGAAQVLTLSPTYTGGGSVEYLAGWSYSILGSDGNAPTVITDSTNGQLVTSRTITGALDAGGGYMSGLCGNGTAIPTMTTGTSDATSGASGFTGNDECRLAHNTGTTTTTIVWGCNNTDYSCATGLVWAPSGGTFDPTQTPPRWDYASSILRR